VNFRSSLKRGVWLGVFLRCLFMGPPLWASEDVVKQVRARYPVTPLSAVEKVALLSEVAQTLGPEWGILRKQTGHVCLGSDGQSYSCDHICRLDQSVHVDVLGDEETTATPLWRSSGPIDPPRIFCAAALGSAAPIPDSRIPNAPAPIPTLDLSPVHQKLDALALDLARVERQLDEHAKREEEHWRNVKGQWERIWKPLLGFVGKYGGPLIGGVIAGIYGS